jgi:deoxyribodipyrimidine photo-lyase
LSKTYCQVILKEEKMSSVSLFWFRRDLRLKDNAGLYHALKEGAPVVPIFIFDTDILDKLSNKKDTRVHFIHDTITDLKKQLAELGSSIEVRYGKPLQEIDKLTEQYDVKSVFTNRDYEPYAKQRDKEVHELLKEKGIAFHTYKDHVIFEGLEVEKKAGGVYTVFSPYGRMWRSKLESRMDTFINDQGEQEEGSYYLKPYPTESFFDRFHSFTGESIPTLEEMDFEPSDIPVPSKIVDRGLIKKYDKTRNFPALKGTSRLGIHFRFGTISIREKARRAQKLNDTFFNELIWRDFYAMILDNFPHVDGNAFREKYERIEWRNNEEEFEKWCQGKTGYPIVDAGMRELNTTGYMHNRVRMITASFLTKHLLIDWRWGEAYFAEKLLDFDLSSNNGGWQWAAGSGTDAAPYFRVFNPTSQLKKFDEDLKYVKRWVPEYGTSEYPDPVVDHKFARERCLDTYKEALSND